ncbi:hypothetical protein Peur_064061 [Populus x canadensis]
MSSSSSSCCCLRPTSYSADGKSTSSLVSYGGFILTRISLKGHVTISVIISKKG